MSITNVQVIEDSLRLVGVVGESQPVTAEQGSLMLRVLNQVMEDWAASGTEIGYFAQTSTTDTCPIPDWAQRGVTSRLAQAGMAFYPGSTPTQDLMDDERNGITTIRRISALEKLQPLDMSHLGLGEGWGTRFNIETGV